MAVRNIKRVVGVAGRVMKRTACQVRSELMRLEREGVLSRKDVGKLVGIVSREAKSASMRVARFVKSEVKHESSLARSLVRAAVERTRRASKVLSAAPRKAAKRTMKRRKR